MAAVGQLRNIEYRTYIDITNEMRALHNILLEVLKSKNNVALSMELRKVR